MVEKNAQEYTPKTPVKVKLNLKKNIVDKVDKKHNKYYYEFDRNLDNAKQSNTNQYNGKTRTGGLQIEYQNTIKVKKVMKLEKYVIILICLIIAVQL